jgi:hypothetical protein
MPIDRIITASIQDGAVVPADLSTGAPTWDTSGNVGIGTSSPASILDVQSPVGDMRLTATTGTNLCIHRITNTGGTFYIGRDNSTGSNFGAAYASILWSQGAYPMQFATNDTERMRIDSSGNVGIGTTGPSAKVHISGSSSTDFKALTIRNSDGTTGSAAVLGFEASTGALGDDSSLAGQIKGIRTGAGTSGALAFWTNNAGTPAERARIDSSGRFAILANTTQYSQDAGLTVNGTGLTRAIFININGTSAATQISFGNGNGVVGSVTTSGSTTSYNPSSDRRLKEDIQPMTDGLERVMKLKPVTYNWKSDGAFDDGFIAQDLQEIPEFAHRVNPIGERDGEMYYGVDYMKFVGVLTAAIQEQQQMIEELKAEVAALKGQA